MRRSFRANSRFLHHSLTDVFKVSQCVSQDRRYHRSMYQNLDRYGSPTFYVVKLTARFRELVLKLNRPTKAVQIGDRLGVMG